MKIGFCMFLWTTNVTSRHARLLKDIKATGYDGVMAYTALFVLLTTPKSPTSIRRSDYKLAKHWLPQASSGGSAREAAARRAIG